LLRTNVVGASLLPYFVRASDKTKERPPATPAMAGFVAAVTELAVAGDAGAAEFEDEIGNHGKVDEEEDESGNRGPVNEFVDFER